MVGTPKPQGSKNGYVRGGRVVLVEASKGLKDWRSVVTAAVTIVGQAENWKRIDKDTPAHLTIRFIFTKPKSAKRPAHTTKPDLSKLIRAVEDAITDTHIIWADDSQVVSVFAVKEYGPVAKASIEIAEINND